MQNNYIIYTKDNKLVCFYYTEDFKIYCKTYENNKWSKGSTVISGVREYYTINMSENGELYLFCQNTKGHIMLCRNNGLEWSQSTILENKVQKIQNILFNSIITNNGLSIVYNVPIIDEKAHFLTAQSLNNNGKWLESTRIDKISALPNTIFQTQTIKSNHIIVFYQKRTPETNLGYREITPNKIGAFNVFHTTNYQIIDHSFLTTNKAIHFLYIVKGMFSNQIFYRKKESNVFDNPIVLSEGQKLGNCCLSIIHNKIYASWTYGSQLYQCTSDDYGNSFTRPTKYKRKFCLNPQKAVYLSYKGMTEDNFVIRELYVDSTNPSDIQLIPDLYEEFYPSYNKVEKKVVETIEPEVSTEFDEEIEKLKNQIFINKAQLEQKDKQIMQLTTLLQKKNEEILNSANNWRMKYKKAIDENNQFKNTFNNSNNYNEFDDTNTSSSNSLVYREIQDNEDEMYFDSVIEKEVEDNNE